MDMRNKIRTILIECRVQSKLTQAEVGQIVGKSKNAVASWEQGLSLPDIVTLYKLSRYYGHTVDYMYGLESDDK